MGSPPRSHMIKTSTTYHPLLFVFQRMSSHFIIDSKGWSPLYWLLMTPVHPPHEIKHTHIEIMQSNDNACSSWFCRQSFAVAGANWKWYFSALTASDNISILLPQSSTFRFSVTRFVLSVVSKSHFFTLLTRSSWKWAEFELSPTGTRDCIPVILCPNIKIATSIQKILYLISFHYWEVFSVAADFLPY